MTRTQSKTHGRLIPVAHIEAKTGPHGGEFWWLTLECGHFKAVRKPRFREHQILRRKMPFAPRRVKCLVCVQLASRTGEVR